MTYGQAAEDVQACQQGERDMRAGERQIILGGFTGMSSLGRKKSAGYWLSMTLTRQLLLRHLLNHQRFVQVMLAKCNVVLSTLYVIVKLLQGAFKGIALLCIDTCLAAHADFLGPCLSL